MKKLINAPDDLREELLQGLVAAHPTLARLSGTPVLLRSDWPPPSPRVAIVSGGGSGHEPAHAGYVGPGMLTAAVCGQVFTSPGVDDVEAAINAVATAGGVLLIVKNYTGDRLNFGIAAAEARIAGLPVETVIVADDVALALSVDNAGRRGIAGTVLVHKVAGAAAEARAAADNVRTMGVALAPCTVPAAGKPTFTLDDDEVELGLGIHGEPGVRKTRLAPVDDLVDQLLGPILTDLAASPGDRVVLLVNNLGATPPMELALAARHAIAAIEQRKLSLERVYVGTFLSAIDMAGLSLSLMKVDDQRLARLDAPTAAPAWPNHANTPHTPAASRQISQQSPEIIFESYRTDPGPVSKHLAAAFPRLIAAVRAHEAQLTELDRAVGDGDLGQNLRRGADALEAELPTLDGLDDVAALLHASYILRKAIGGTTGPLHAALLLGMARSLATSSDRSPAAWVDAARAGAAEIGQLGGARRGDRTLLDALLPAIDQLTLQPTNLAAAARVARDAAAATAELLPRRGRASYLGERALGHPDPGAIEVALLFEALANNGDH